MLHLQQYYVIILIYKMQVYFLRGNKTLKKSIITLLLASFILTEITPAACFAIGNKNQSNEPKKVSITKTDFKKRIKDIFMTGEHLKMLMI